MQELGVKEQENVGHIVFIKKSDGYDEEYHKQMKAIKNSTSEFFSDLCEEVIILMSRK